MVYCGKASQGCKLCRTRRIKCDKLRPECSQCIRVGKACPGYRDQLSLMFRDESKKVIQKAHAQWGSGPLEQANPQSAVSTSSSASWTSTSPPSSTAGERPSPGSQSPPDTSKLQTSNSMQLATPPRLHPIVEPSLEDKGIQFYMSRYLMTQPDAPELEQLEQYSGRFVAMRNVMVAVGLAGLANTQGDRSVGLLSRQVYTTALQQTGSLIAMATKSPDPGAFIATPLRAIVMLALFEVVQGKGSKLSTGTANMHIFGAVALLRSIIPLSSVPAGGSRAVLQLMFSLFIPSQLSETPLPPAFFECLKICRDLLPDEEKCACNVAIAIARFLQVATKKKRSKLVDGHKQTDEMLQQLLGMDAVLNRLEEQMRIGYPYREEVGDFPRIAVFHGKYHQYTEIWGARLWNHLRWVRILVEQTIIEWSSEFPLSSSRIISPEQHRECLKTMTRLAEDILVSTPSHWHHPILEDHAARKFAALGKGGSGAAGLPTLLWHLKVAACAPGVPTEFWDWSHAIMQVVWREMGMQHALALGEVMEGYRAGQEKEAIDHHLKIEEADW